MPAFWVTWTATGTAYVEAQSAQDAIMVFDRDPSEYVPEPHAEIFAEYASEAHS